MHLNIEYVNKYIKGAYMSTIEQVYVRS